MIIMDGQTPKGRVLKPKGQYFNLAPLTTRQMTDEDWAKYGGLDSKGAEYRKRNIEAMGLSRQKGRGTEPVIVNSDFAAQVKAEREKQGMTIYNMGDLCGLSHATIANIEKGKPIKKRTARKICEVFGWGKECFS